MPKFPLAIPPFSSVASTPSSFSFTFLRNYHFSLKNGVSHVHTFLSPLRGSPWAAPTDGFRGLRSRDVPWVTFTPLALTPPTAVLCLRGLHPRLCYVTATRFSVGCTHGCVMSPLRGSPWVAPTAVLCHRYAVHSSVFSATSIGFDISPYGCTATIQKTASETDSGRDT